MVHNTVLIIFPLILQTIVISDFLSNRGERVSRMIGLYMQVWHAGKLLNMSSDDYDYIMRFKTVK